MREVDKVPLTSPEIRTAMVSVRRIKSLAESKGYDDRITLWCGDLEESINKMGIINRKLRHAARTDK